MAKNYNLSSIIKKLKLPLNLAFRKIYKNWIGDSTKALNASSQNVNK